MLRVATHRLNIEKCESARCGELSWWFLVLGGTKSAVSFIDVGMFCISQHSSIASKAAMDHALLRAAEPWVHTEGLCRGGMKLLVSSGDP